MTEQMSISDKHSERETDYETDRIQVLNNIRRISAYQRFIDLDKKFNPDDT